MSDIEQNSKSKREELSSLLERIKDYIEEKEERINTNEEQCKLESEVEDEFYASICKLASSDYEVCFALATFGDDLLQAGYLRLPFKLYQLALKTESTDFKVENYLDSVCCCYRRLTETKEDCNALLKQLLTQAVDLSNKLTEPNPGLGEQFVFRAADIFALGDKEQAYKLVDRAIYFHDGERYAMYDMIERIQERIKKYGKSDQEAIVKHVEARIAEFVSNKSTAKCGM